MKIPTSVFEKPTDTFRPRWCVDFEMKNKLRGAHKRIKKPTEKKTKKREKRVHANCQYNL